jgi:hypothetical protein
MNTKTKRQSTSKQESSLLDIGLSALKQRQQQLGAELTNISAQIQLLEGARKIDPNIIRVLTGIAQMGAEQEKRPYRRIQKSPITPISWMGNLPVIPDAGKSGGRLSPAQDKVLEVLRKNPGIKSNMIAEMAGIEPKSVSNSLMRLKKNGSAHKVGYGQWEAR